MILPMLAFVLILAWAFFACSRGKTVSTVTFRELLAK